MYYSRAIIILVAMQFLVEWKIPHKQQSRHNSIFNAEVNEHEIDRLDIQVSSENGLHQHCSS
jgi:hypothetical protein